MTIEKTVEHHWKPMEEFRCEEDTEDFLDLTDGDKIRVLRRLRPNQYIKWCGEINVEAIDSLLSKLRREGLDIGRGGCEYGYRAQIPPNGGKKRKLIIFRRYSNG